MKFTFHYKLCLYIVHLVFRGCFTSTMSTHSNLKTTSQQPTLTPLPPHMQPCPCAINVHCPPCNNNNVFITESTPQLTCPCAQCPPCISLSLMHDLSSKKAMHDQQTTVNLKKLNDKIGKHFDVIIKSLSDVVNYEQEARDKAKLMEEASIKAMIARRKMIDMSEKARYIAKMGIVERKSCVEGDDCAVNGDLYEGRIFPEEVSTIKDDDENDNSNNNHHHIYTSNNNYYKPNNIKSLKIKYLSNNT